MNEKNNGQFGYRVYKDGSQIAFTTDNYYTYTPDYPYGTYTVRTCFKNVTTNMSSPATASIESKIKFEFNDESETTLPIGSTYTPTSNPVSVYENDEDVTSNANITNKIIDNATGKEVAEIDTTVVGSYTVQYTASYRGESEIFSKNITVN